MRFVGRGGCWELFENLPQIPFQALKFVVIGRNPSVDLENGLLQKVGREELALKRTIDHHAVPFVTTGAGKPFKVE